MEIYIDVSLSNSNFYSDFLEVIDYLGSIYLKDELSSLKISNLSNLIFTR